MAKGSAFPHALGGLRGAAGANLLLYPTADVGVDILLVPEGALEHLATHTINSKNTDALEEIKRICGGPADFALECTGVIPVVEQAIDSVGMLGTCILVGGAPAGARFSVDHLTALWGKRIIGTLGGSGTSQDLIPALIKLRREGRFPFDRLVKFFELDQVEDALAASGSGEVIKPILRISQP